MPARSFPAPGHAYIGYVLGILAGVPVAIPSEPFYWFATVVSAFAILHLQVPRERLLLLVLYVGIGALATLISDAQQLASLPRSIPIVLATVFVIAGFGIEDRLSFVKGFCTAMAGWSLLVIAAYFLLGISSHGIGAFIYPDLRLWGASYFPDWPNFLAFGLGLSALLAVTYLRSHAIGALCAAAAVLTTSRMALVAWLFLGLYWANLAIRRRAGLVVVTALLIVSMLVLLINWTTALAIAEAVSSLSASAYADRLIKVGDRAQIWSAAAGIVSTNPFLGIGAVPLDESVGLPSSSIHNSYLDVVLRTGFVGLCVWLLLFLPSVGVLRQNRAIGIVFLYFLVSAFFNNVLKHPHYLLVYGVLLAGLPDRRRNADEPVL